MRTPCDPEGASAVTSTPPGLQGLSQGRLGTHSAALRTRGFLPARSSRSRRRRSGGRESAACDPGARDRSAQWGGLRDTGHWARGQGGAGHLNSLSGTGPWAPGWGPRGGGQNHEGQHPPAPRGPAGSTWNLPSLSHWHIGSTLSQDIHLTLKGCAPDDTGHHRELPRAPHEGRAPRLLGSLTSSRGQGRRGPRCCRWVGRCHWGDLVTLMPVHSDHPVSNPCVAQVTPVSSTVQTRHLGADVTFLKLESRRQDFPEANECRQPRPWEQLLSRTIFSSKSERQMVY